MNSTLVVVFCIHGLYIRSRLMDKLVHIFSLYMIYDIYYLVADLGRVGAFPRVRNVMCSTVKW